MLAIAIIFIIIITLRYYCHDTLLLTLPMILGHMKHMMLSLLRDYYLLLLSTLAMASCHYFKTLLAMTLLLNIATLTLEMPLHDGGKMS